MVKGFGSLGVGVCVVEVVLDVLIKADLQGTTKGPRKNHNAESPGVLVLDVLNVATGINRASLVKRRHAVGRMVSWTT